MSLVIVNYGSGNIASVANMVRREGGRLTISTQASDIASATKLILPGVGAFDYGVSQLRDRGLFSAIKDRVTEGIPILGICAGMQLLGTGSEEGVLEGLGLIDAEFRRFAFDDRSNLRIPHVGWNQIRVAKENPLIVDDGTEQRFYFTHSYHAVCKNAADVLATAEYGYSFASAYSHAHVYGVQFHPEKSHRFGMALIRRFLEL